MNKKYNKLKTEFIRETFKDKRKIRCGISAKELQIDESIHQGGDIFITEDGEFIDLEFQERDFDEEELANYVELAEDIYDKHHKPVSIYIICPDNIDVCVREFTIKSEADFTIKLAKVEDNRAEDILNRIKCKMRNREMLDEKDLHDLEILPLICKKNEKKYYRVEVFKIMNRILY